jgi:cation:H+ antiporter
MLSQALVDTLLVIAGTGLLWWACEHLETASHRLAQLYRLPEIVKGSIVMAVSSSFPEFVTIVLSGWWHGEFELGLATIIGSAIFNILVIPACSALMRHTPLQTDRHLIFRETQFYLISIMLVMLVLSLSVIHNPAPDNSLHGALTREMALLLPVFYLIYVYIQYQEVREHRPDVEPVDVRPLREWLRLLIAMLVVTAGVEILIRTALSLGQLFDTPAWFWGITVLAAATSVPDLFLSLQAARRDISISSLSNALGSNIFDLLVALPAGALAAGTVVIHYRRIMPTLAFLVFATVVVLVLMRRDFRLDKRDALLLLVLYTGFVVWMALGSFNTHAGTTPAG